MLLKSEFLNYRYALYFKKKKITGTSSIGLDGFKCSNHRITSGIPRGSNLGPLYFSGFIDDLNSTHHNST